MRTKKVILLTFIIVLAVIPINLCLGTTTVKNDLIAVTINIEDAYYYAEDSDGLENDIASIFTLDIEKVHNDYFTIFTNFYLLLGVTLPSGKYYGYLFNVYCICNSGIHERPTAYFIDHATEPGWYLVEITVILVEYNTITDFGTESFYFDPPGGTDGTNPDGCRIVF